MAAAKAEAALRQQAEQAVESETKALQAEERALAAQTKAREEAEAMTAMLDSLLLSVKPGKDTLGSLRKQLDITADQLQTDERDPILRARLLYSLAMTRRTIGDYEPAVELMEHSFALRKEHLGADHPKTRKTAKELAYTYIHVKRGEDAVRLLKPLTDSELAALPPDSVDSIDHLHLLMLAYSAAGRRDEQQAVGEQIVALCEKHYGSDDTKTHWERSNLASLYRKQKQFDKALPILEAAFAHFCIHCEPYSTEILWTRGELGLCLLQTGLLENALPYLRETYDSDIVFHGPNHPITIQHGDLYASACEQAGNFAEAAPVRQALYDHFDAIDDRESADFQSQRLAEDLASARK